MSLCRSVCWSVGHPKSLCYASLFSVFWAERFDLSYCPCPTTILPLPTRMLLMLSCIRPCFVPVSATSFGWRALPWRIHLGFVGQWPHLREKQRSEPAFQQTVCLLLLAMKMLQHRITIFLHRSYWHYYHRRHQLFLPHLPLVQLLPRL